MIQHIKHSISDKMDKNTFNKLLKNLPEIKKEQEKALERDGLAIDFNEDREEVYILLWEIVFVFDQEGYAILDKIWRGPNPIIPKNNYLYVKDKEWGELIPVHRYLKLDEVEELSKKMGFDIKDIHVHHIDKDKQNNFLNNLEVLHKDDHAKRHGFDTWEEYQEWRKEKGNEEK